MATRQAVLASMLMVFCLWGSEVAAQNCGPTGNTYEVEIREPSPGRYEDACKGGAVRTFTARRNGTVILRLKNSTTTAGLTLHAANFRCVVPPNAGIAPCPITNPGCTQRESLTNGRQVRLRIGNANRKACGNSGRDLYAFDLIVDNGGVQTVVDPQLEIDRESRIIDDYLVAIVVVLGALLAAVAWWVRRLRAVRSTPR